MRKSMSKIIMLIIAVIGMMLIPNEVHAGLQANKGGTSLDTTIADDFFTLIKAMETGTLAKANQGAEDGIDCHMAKNTEWGGAALLALCPEFGVKPADNNADSTTTGNASGIYQMSGNKLEYTSNYFVGNTSTKVARISQSGKYANAYDSKSARVDGDALNLGSLYGNWEARAPLLARGFQGTLLNYVGYGTGPTNWAYNPYGGDASGEVGSRAAVVNGAGL